MILRRLFIGLWAAAFATAGAASDDLQVRLWATQENTRLVLETAEPLSYSVNGLSDPPRLIVDLSSRTGSLEKLHDNKNLKNAMAYISDIRTARRNNDTLRIVFDLKAEINYKINQLLPVAGYDHRLVINVHPTTEPPDPLLALIEQLGAINKPFVVLIDPGHGGEDPGAVSPNGNYEKNIVLSISRQLAQHINTLPGMRALLTRDNDRFIKLFDRVKIAQRLNADAFISIHADSVKSPKARGSSVFILSKKGASTKFARQLAQNENLSDLIGGAFASTTDPELESALREMSLDGKDKASRLLAELLLQKIKKVNRLHSSRIESAGFAVLKSPSIPSVLVETAFISNPTEEKKLLDMAFQQKLVNAIGDALQQYREKYHIQ